MKGHFLAKGQFILSFSINTETPTIIVAIRNIDNGFLIIPNCFNINIIPAIIISAIKFILSPLLNKKQLRILRIAYKFIPFLTLFPAPL